MIGIVFSIIFPGLGQIYFRKTSKGILMICLSIIPYIYPFALIWSIIDSIYLNKTVSKENRMSAKEAIIAFIIVFTTYLGILSLFIYTIHNILKDLTWK